MRLIMAILKARLQQAQVSCAEDTRQQRAVRVATYCVGFLVVSFYTYLSPEVSVWTEQSSKGLSNSAQRGLKRKGNSLAKKSYVRNWMVQLFDGVCTSNTWSTFRQLLCRIVEISVKEDQEASCVNVNFPLGTMGAQVVLKKRLSRLVIFKMYSLKSSDRFQRVLKEWSTTEKCATPPWRKPQAHSAISTRNDFHRK